MAYDPGLTRDSCVYMEAVSGDGGVHDSNGVWWLSPDIALASPLSGPDKADPGVYNTVDVTFHMAAAQTNCALPPGTESITIDLWVGNPSLAMAPNNAASTKHVDSIGMPITGPGTSQTYQFKWMLSVPPSDPEKPGHKCLIARAYADPLTPNPTNFFTPGDPHVAQHNICIVPCGGPGAAKRPGSCGQPVKTLNPGIEAQLLKIRAVLDLEPNKFVRDVVMQRLKRTEGFARLATAPPRAFTLEAKGARASPENKDRKKIPSCEILVNGKPGYVFDVMFSANLSGAKLGDAYIFHLTQAGQDGLVHGGLTVVMMAA